MQISPLWNMAGLAALDEHTKPSVCERHRQILHHVWTFSEQAELAWIKRLFQLRSTRKFRGSFGAESSFLTTASGASLCRWDFFSLPRGSGWGSALTHCPTTIWGRVVKVCSLSYSAAPLFYSPRHPNCLCGTSSVGPAGDPSVN